MNDTVTVFGYGAVGQATTELLARQGREVIVAQRSAPRSLPRGVKFIPCDVLDAESVHAAVRGADQVVLATGFPYVGALWRTAWPATMTHMVSALEAYGPRMVFVDNLYMYGPQNEPLTEDMPLADHGVKPKSRSDATRIWQAAAKAGRARVAALRPSDFFGPGARTTQLGDLAFGSLARGKAAQMVMPPDTPHDFAYVPDIARAVGTLLDAPDDAYGEVWHVPCAPTRTPRQILEIAAKALNVKPGISALPLWLLPLIGAASPGMRELVEMRFQWDRPYLVDSSKFAQRFWSDPTPFEVSVAETARWFREADKRG